ncbi:hypothetical protein EB796_024920 [Bugula neritina]|uniref:EF-hand domain-containing protein n=1 Tax=Bugula neritina TaxID=10212 RepID=A0A7J7IT67_BUGNE|nr:hypothetical protein EB796_024920 [Bugula neritina]
MKFLVFAVAVVAAALSADPTTAPPTFNPNVAFDLLDANKDGKVEKLEYDSTFASYDANNDMLITASEFANNFVKTGMSAEGSIYVFYKIDQNDNQQVDSAEIDMSFSSFDLDKSMTIEAAEFNNVFKSIIYELSIAKAVGIKLDVLFAAADTDGSNSLNAVEFSSLLTPADTDSKYFVT